MEKKAIQMKGGTCQGAANPTWLKQKEDIPVAVVALAATLFGMSIIARGHYHLAYGINKKEWSIDIAEETFCACSLCAIAFSATWKYHAQRLLPTSQLRN